MLTSIRGVYRDGKIKLYEEVPDIESAEVIVTFIPLEGGGVDLSTHDITPERAAELRRRLQTFEEDWNAPGMEVYDNL